MWQKGSSQGRGAVGQPSSQGCRGSGNQGYLQGCLDGVSPVSVRSLDRGRPGRLEEAGVGGREGRLYLFCFALFRVKKQVVMKSRAALFCSRGGFRQAH